MCFEKFLELFAAAYPLDLHIIQLDNGGFHSSLNLNQPENVILLFQPAYSPECKSDRKAVGVDRGTIEMVEI